MLLLLGLSILCGVALLYDGAPSSTRELSRQPVLWVPCEISRVICLLVAG